MLKRSFEGVLFRDDSPHPAANPAQCRPKSGPDPLWCQLLSGLCLQKITSPHKTDTFINSDFWQQRCLTASMQFCCLKPFLMCSLFCSLTFTLTHSLTFTLTLLHCRTVSLSLALCLAPPLPLNRTCVCLVSHLGPNPAQWLAPVCCHVTFFVPSLLCPP